MGFFSAFFRSKKQKLSRGDIKCIDILSSIAESPYWEAEALHQNGEGNFDMKFRNLAIGIVRIKTTLKPAANPNDAASRTEITVLDFLDYSPSSYTISSSNQAVLKEADNLYNAKQHHTNSYKEK